MIETITEEQLTPQQAEFWVRARQAVDMNNYPYAVSLLKALVKQLPGFLEGRKALRACEIKLNPEAKRGGLFSGMKISTSKLTSSKKDAATQLSALEDELEHDPYSIPVNEALFMAAMEVDFPDLAAFALETVRQGHPGNKKMLHMLASHYVSRDMPAQAAEVYHDLVKLDPTDSVAVKSEKDCMARATMQQQKWEEAKSFRDVMKNSSETNTLDKSDIAGVYEQMEDWANAYSFYNYAFSLSNNDISLENKASEMNERCRKAQVEEIRRRAAAEPDNKELQEQLAQFSKEAAEQQVALCRQRVENNPTDPQTRFELGQALFDCGNYTEAIPELQRARNNPHIRIRAMLLLGKCYDAKNMHDMALRQLEEANKELIEMNDTKKEILYMIGLLYEKQGKKGESLAAFQQIYDAEYGYRDVARRVESSYGN
ncbi:tetratricopeptide repeat protein [uncultured Akkermansia sp.]|uniref:tetratricopeptide repeat protein n=1 Tax=uncultured Akkermansia sp. TaxID=512294 RepID=UPI00260E87A9|nr:tetratricopeptide repeat protein [uncultured Akkermansia sp.]